MNAKKLTEREVEIVRYMAKGLTAQQIAFHLRLNADTVELYQKNIARKLNEQTNAGMVARAIKMKLI